MLQFFFSDDELLQNLPFDETLHVLSSDNYASGDTKFIPEENPGSPGHSPKKFNFDVFLRIFQKSAGNA